MLLAAICLLVISSWSCTTPSERRLRQTDTATPADTASSTSTDTGRDTGRREAGAAIPTQDTPVVLLGTGQFVEPPTEPWSRDARGQITLNFDNADLREVVRIIMRDILQQNYIIDPRVQGKVTIQTSRPLARSSVWSVLETVLQVNGAALIRDDGTPRIVPLANAVHVAPPASVAGSKTRQGEGYGVEIVPLQFVSAREIASNLEGFIGPGTSVRVDEERNLLIMSGPRPSLRWLLDTVMIFDVDWLQGLSFALYPLGYVAPATLIDDLRKIIGTDPNGVLDGVVRLEAVDRLNALLVVSKQPRYIAEIEQLVKELDQGANTPGRQLHVYHVENSSAEYIAGVLEQLFGGKDKEDEEEEGPGLLGPRELTAGLPLSRMEREAQERAAADATQQDAATPDLPLIDPGQTAQPVTVIADKANNALFIMASAADYRMVEVAIRQLDVRPRQVLIEATIAEVTLNDSLQYGVQWFLKGVADDYTLRAGLSSTSSAALPGAAAPGFFFSATDIVNDVRLLFDLLANESQLKVLSSPQVLVIDNETASIRVGDSIPVVTRQSTAVVDPDAPTVNEIQYRDTGVLLQVTPRINEGGLVTMEITQEVSQPSADEFAAGNPAILQRTIESSVAVPSSEAVLLGGLIRENNTETLTGIPGLMHLPLIGPLFGRTVNSVSRTELIVTISPTVIEDQNDADRSTAELRRRLEAVGQWLKDVKY